MNRFYEDITEKFLLGKINEFCQKIYQDNFYTLWTECLEPDLNEKIEITSTQLEKLAYDYITIKFEQLKAKVRINSLGVTKNGFEEISYFLLEHFWESFEFKGYILNFFSDKMHDKKIELGI